MWTDATTRASGGSRTRNPRITNAVLCQLKLRWHGRGEGSPAAATRKSSAPGVASSSQRIHRRGRAELRHEPGVSDPAGASCQNGAGQGQDDRTVGPWAGDSGLGSWGRAGGPLITQVGMHVACQTAFFFFCRRDSSDAERRTAGGTREEAFFDRARSRAPVASQSETGAPTSVERTRRFAARAAFRVAGSRSRSAGPRAGIIRQMRARLLHRCQSSAASLPHRLSRRP